MEEIPDVLGHAGRTAVVTKMFEEVQRQLFALEVEQTANNGADEDPVPNTGLGHNGAITSYGSRREELLAAQDRLAEKYADVVPQIAERV